MITPDANAGGFTIVNLSSKNFKSSWDSQPYEIEGREVISLAPHLARHFAKHGRRDGIRMYNADSSNCDDCGAEFTDGKAIIEHALKEHNFDEIKSKQDQAEADRKAARNEEILARMAAKLK